MTSRVGLVELVDCSVRLNGLVCDLIIEAMSNTESQILATTVDLLKQDSRSNFVMKLSLGTSPHSYVFTTTSSPVPSCFI